MNPLRIALFLILALSARYSFSASFDCAKASSNVEKIICSSDVISKLDEELSKTYKVSLGHTKDAEYLKKEQVDWLVFNRNKCKDSACVEEAYKTRIERLNSVQTTCSVRKFVDLVLTKKDLVSAKEMVGDDSCNSHYLSYAISSNNSEFALFVLGHVNTPPEGEDVDRASRANPEILEAVVKKGGNVNYVEKQYGYYPLLSAINSIYIPEEKILANVKFLLSRGANVNHIDKFRNTALRNAITHNYVTVAKYLLEKGADPVQFEPEMEQDGFSIIMQAIKFYESNKDSRIVKELLARGVDPNTHDKGSYSYECDMENVNKCTWNGYSLLTYSARHNLSEIVQLLIDAGADVNLPRSDGKSAKEIATSLGYKNIVLILEKQKAK